MSLDTLSFDNVSFRELPKAVKHAKLHLGMIQSTATQRLAVDPPTHSVNTEGISVLRPNGTPRFGPVGSRSGHNPHLHADEVVRSGMARPMTKIVAPAAPNNFVIISEQRSGAKYLMDLLNLHPQIKW